MPICRSPNRFPICGNYIILVTTEFHKQDFDSSADILICWPWLLSAIFGSNLFYIFSIPSAYASQSENRYLLKNSVLLLYATFSIGTHVPAHKQCFGWRLLWRVEQDGELHVGELTLVGWPNHHVWTNTPSQYDTSKEIVLCPKLAWC